MASTTPDYTIRQCAQDLIRHLDQYRGNMAEAEELAIPYMQRLMARPDLLELGIKRDANHTGDAVTLYYDHELTIVLGKMPKGTAIPVHNHGTWEVVAPYRGEIKYTMYHRNDDMTKPGYADLTVIDDRVMKKGDVSVCPPPPHDVHGFTALTDDLLIFAIVGGDFVPIRQYYKPDEKAYIERHQQAWRLGGQKD
jgi:predicted metal-dependent enzyme (double-stranded beta helix superfamily)